MQEPFPALTHLVLSSDIEPAPVVPGSFMGGSAPRLQDLRLEGVPIPGLPKLLSSATDLVHLILRRIPHSGYISPEAIVTCLSSLPRLEKLYLGFESPRSRPNRETRRPPPLTRFVLPALIKFHWGQRISGGPRGPDRLSSTRVFGNIAVPSAHIRHSTARPVHQPHANAQSARSSTCGLLRFTCQSHIPEDVFQLPPRVENLMQTTRVAAFVHGTNLHLVLPSAFH